MIVIKSLDIKLEMYDDDISFTVKQNGEYIFESDDSGVYERLEKVVVDFLEQERKNIANEHKQVNKQTNQSTGD